MRLDKLDEESKAANQANEWFYEQQAIHQQILDNAIELQDKLDREHLEERAKIPTTYAVGNYMLLGYPESSFTGSRRPPTKLLPYRKGPMKITDVKGDEYELLDLVSRQSHSVHVSRVYPFWYDDTRVDHENIASRDAEEYVVDRIVDDTIDERKET